MHCRVTQSVLTFLCSSDGRSRKVKFEKFRQPCGIQAAACWEAVETGKLKIGKLEHVVIMNAMRSHLGGGEDCSQGFGYQIEFLDRKVTQVLMKILVKREWIWWSETVGKVTSMSGEMAPVKWSWGTDCVCGQVLSRVGCVELPTAGRGSAAFN